MGEEPERREYRIEVARRKASDFGYKTEPFYAMAHDGRAVIAVQYGSAPGIAFQRAWKVLQEYREREPVTVDV